VTQSLKHRLDSLACRDRVEKKTQLTQSRCRHVRCILFASASVCWVWNGVPSSLSGHCLSEPAVTREWRVLDAVSHSHGAYPSCSPSGLLSTPSPPGHHSVMSTSPFVCRTAFYDVRAAWFRWLMTCDDGLVVWFREGAARVSSSRTYRTEAAAGGGWVGGSG